MTIETYRLKSPVEAALLTEENMLEIAEWCKGLLWVPHEKAIGIYFYTEDSTRIYVLLGEWIVKNSLGVFQKYTPFAFEQTFEK